MFKGLGMFRCYGLGFRLREQVRHMQLSEKSSRALAGRRSKHMQKKRLL